MAGEKGQLVKDANDELAELIRTLHETEQRINDLTGGQVDAITLPSGASYLLQEAQKNLRKREAEHRYFSEMRASILNALPAHIALLDTRGRIIAVNEAWKRFGRENGLAGDDYAVGGNYLEVCEQSTGDCSEGAGTAAMGIRAVLEGMATVFELEYPCHSPHEQRWFRLTVTPLSTDRRGGAVVMHVNITERKLGEEQLRASEGRYRAIVENEPECVTVVSEDGRLLDINPAGLEMIEMDSLEEARGMQFGGLFHPEGREAFDELHGRALHGERRQMELRLIGRRGTARWMEMHSAPLRNPDGTISSVLSVTRDITERRSAQTRLKQREALLRMAGKVARLGAWAAYLDDRRIFWSAEACEILGYEEGFIPSLEEVLDLFAPESRQRLWDAVNSCLDSGTPFQLEVEARTISGRQIFARCRGEAERDAKGRIVRAQGAFQDITEHKHIIEELNRRETLLRIAGKLARVGGWAVTLPDHKVYWSDEMYHLLEFPVGEMPPANEGLALYTPDSLEKLTAAMHGCTTEGVPFDLELQIHTATGRLLWVRSCGEADRDADGQVTRVHGAFQDITDQKMAEEEVLTSEERLSYLAMATVDAIWDWDLATDEVWWNHAFFTLFGYEREEIEPASLSWTRRVHPEDRTRVMATMEAVIESGEAIWENRYRFLRKDGRYAHVVDRGFVIRDAQGHPLRMIGGMTDVSGQVEAKDALAEKDALMRIAGKLARVGGWAVTVKDREQVKLFWSDEMYDILGYSPDEEIPALEGLDNYTPESLKLLTDSVEECIASGKSFDLELKVRTKDDRWLTVRVTGEADRDANGTITKVHGALQDITERVMAEAAIKESEERFRKVLQDVPSVAVQGYSMDGTVKYWNKASEELYGYTAEEAMKGNLLDLIIPEEMHDGVRAAMKNAIAAGEHIPAGELSLKRKDGSRVSVYSSHAIVRRTGAPPEMFCIDVDLTEHKRLRRQLEESEERMRRIFAHAATGICVTSPDGAIVQANAAYCRFLGYPEDELISRDVMSLTHPEDRPHNIHLYEELLRGHLDSYILEKRQLRKDGSIVWGRVSVSAIRDADVKAVNVVGVSEDITERKMAEIMLREKEALLRIAGKTAHFGGWAVFRDDSVYWSDEIYEMLDYPAGFVPPLEEALSLYHPDSLEKISTALQDCFETGRPFDLALQIRSRGGRELWVRCCGEADTDAEGNVTRVHGAFQDITLQRQMEKEGQRLANRLSSTLEHMSDAFVLIDRDWNFIYLNKEAERVLQCKRDELNGKSMWDKFDARRETIAFQEYSKALETNNPVHFCLYYEPIKEWVEVDAFPHDEGLAIYFRVITERLALEEQLRQSQRLDSIGQLTGGVAHDFNNLLTVIMGNSELLLEELQDSSDHRELVESIHEASKAGADLTHRLLAFARKQPLDPKPVNVNELVARLDGMLRRTLGEHVEIEFVRGAGLWRAIVDPAQLESALLNLCINGRDAMSGGGLLTIETSNTWINQDYADQHAEVRPGQYVMLAVSDTGSGIDPENLLKVFEPFFTTKEPGKGTGLGLSMVYGFVKQSRGHIKIYSEPGVGTTVRMYLPRMESEAEDVAEVTAAENLQRGSELILVVEDDEPVRSYAKRQLLTLGYRVMEAVNGHAALKIIREEEGIDLLFTDVVMPGGMNGRQLADAALEIRPELKVLYTSGYTDNAIVHHGRLDPGANLLSKPYGRAQLARKVREVLDESG